MPIASALFREDIPTDQSAGLRAFLSEIFRGPQPLPEEGDTLPLNIDFERAKANPETVRNQAWGALIREWVVDEPASWFEKPKKLMGTLPLPNEGLPSEADAMGGLGFALGMTGAPGGAGGMGSGMRLPPRMYSKIERGLEELATTGKLGNRTIGTRPKANVLLSELKKTFPGDELKASNIEKLLTPYGDKKINPKKLVAATKKNPEALVLSEKELTTEAKRQEDPDRFGRERYQNYTIPPPGATHYQETLLQLEKANTEKVSQADIIKAIENIPPDQLANFEDKLQSTWARLAARYINANEKLPKGLITPKEEKELSDALGFAKSFKDPVHYQDIPNIHSLGLAYKTEKAEYSKQEVFEKARKAFESDPSATNEQELIENRDHIIYGLRQGNYPDPQDQEVLRKHADWLEQDISLRHMNKEFDKQLAASSTTTPEQDKVLYYRSWVKGSDEWSVGDDHEKLRRALIDALGYRDKATAWEVHDLQSDWMKWGRRLGFSDESEEAIKKKRFEIRPREGTSDRFDADKISYALDSGKKFKIPIAGNATKEELDRAIKATWPDDLVPATNFKDDWYKPALQRQIDKAIEHDVDKFRWLTGDTMADRWRQEGESRKFFIDLRDKKAKKYLEKEFGHKAKKEGRTDADYWELQIPKSYKKKRKAEGGPLSLNLEQLLSRQIG